MSAAPDQHDLVRHLPWDSDFFGFKIGRVNAAVLTLEQATELCDWAKAANYRCLYWLADSTEGENLSVARQTNFSFVDLRLELSHPREATSPTLPTSGWRPAKFTDLPQLEAIARATQRDTRFVKDHNFPPELAASLYAKWVSNDFNQHHVAVTVDAADSPTGFITYSVDASNATGHIGLLSVGSDHSGRGLGQKLIRLAVNELSTHSCSSIEVVTQGTNVAAQRAYQSCGFKSLRTAIWFHRWF